MKISDIIPDIERLKEIDKFTRHKRKELMRQYFCNSCDNYAVKEISTQVGDSDQKATRIERYCQKHFDLIIK
ncbi:MAG TPA: hypothetical protein VFR61_09260 [Nitrososphaeraceae archaeon]|nr:hypothetical protein [Nitrososphaeraceae archaeon]